METARTVLGAYLPELDPGPTMITRDRTLLPQTTQHTLVAFFLPRWSSPGESDLSPFAAITHEPAAEMPTVGHDG